MTGTPTALSILFDLVTRNTPLRNQSGWLNEWSVRLLFWEVGESERCGFESGPHSFRTFKPITLKLILVTP